MKLWFGIIGLLWSCAAFAQVTAARDIDKGEVLALSDFIISDVAEDEALAQSFVGRKSLRRILKGRRITNYSIQPQWVIEHGSQVVLILQSDNLEVSVSGIGASNALLGEPAKARHGRKLIEGTAIGPGKLLVGRK